MFAPPSGGKWNFNYNDPQRVLEGLYEMGVKTSKVTGDMTSQKRSDLVYDLKMRVRENSTEDEGLYKLMTDSLESILHVEGIRRRQGRLSGLGHYFTRTDVGYMVKGIQLLNNTYEEKGKGKAKDKQLYKLLDRAEEVFQAIFAAIL